jgi:hypothetical protein
VTLPEAELSFVLAAEHQLEPDAREVFATRMVEHLQAHADPGPGDVDRALRAALVGLWTPPELDGFRGSRWDCETPRFDRVSKLAG